LNRRTVLRGKYIMRILIDKIKKWDRIIFYIVGIYLLFSGVRITYCVLSG